MVLRKLIEKCKRTRNEGEYPEEFEEATGSNSVGYASVYEVGQALASTFGVWKPHGAALGRLLKFSAWVLASTGDSQKRLLRGVVPSVARLSRWRRKPWAPRRARGPREGKAVFVGE